MKKVLKNVLLCLCILAVVLQPLNIYATNYSFTDTNLFCNTVNPLVSIVSNAQSNKMFTTSFYYTSFETLYNEAISYWNLDTSKIKLIIQDKSSSTYYRIQILYSDYDITFSYPYSANSISFTFELPSYTIYKHDQGNDYNATVYNSSTGTITSNGTSSRRWATIPCSLVFSPTSNLTDLYILNSSAPSSDTGSGGGSSADLSNIEHYLANLYLQNGLLISNNFRSYTPDGTPINSSWVGVGEYLTYMMECQQHSVGANKSYSVSYTDRAGNTVSKTNWLAWMGDWILQSTNLLSDIKNYNISTSSDISDINDRLELAFPDDEIELNNNIADSVKDNSTGHGLTASNISKGKGAVDEGISTFEIDTSGSSYTSPFSALSDSDWSFWTQTTYNNLGSGYSFDSEAVLMEADTDVYADNQNTLLNLLGW